MPRGASQRPGKRVVHSEDEEDDEKMEAQEEQEVEEPVPPGKSGAKAAAVSLDRCLQRGVIALTDLNPSSAPEAAADHVARGPARHAGHAGDERRRDEDERAAVRRPGAAARRRGEKCVPVLVCPATCDPR